MEEIKRQLSEIQSSINTRFLDIEKRLDKLEGKQNATDDNVSDLLSVVKNLVQNQNAILDKHTKTAILDKGQLYDALHKSGYKKHDALKELYHMGIVKKDCEGGNTRVTKRPDGKCKRAVTIHINWGD